MRVLLSLLVTAACARTIDAVPRREEFEKPRTEAPRAECHITGSVSPGEHVELYGDRDDPRQFAHFNRRSVALSVSDVPSLVVDRVGLRATTAHGFAMDAWVDRASLQFAARVRIPLARDVAWIPRGTPLTLGPGAGQKVVVSPGTRKLAPVDALVPCSDVTLGPVVREPTLAPAGARYHLSSDRLAVSAAPEGPPVFTVRPRDPAAFVVSVEDTAYGLRLRLQDGIVVDGWVDKKALRPVLGFSGFSASTSCGLSLSHGTIVGPVRLAKPRHAVAIGVGAEPPGVPRGEASGELLVLAEVSGYAKVLPRCREIVPATAFWIPLTDLDVSGVTDTRAADAGCG